MKKKVGNYKGKAIVEGVGEISLLKHEILFNPNQSLEPINDDDTIVYKGNEYVWKLPSPQGEPDSDKWNKYIKALKFFQSNAFECIYVHSYSGEVEGFRTYSASRIITKDIVKTLPNSYIYDYIEYVREMPFKEPLTDIIYDSLVDKLMKQESMSEEDVIKLITENMGLERIPLDDYKEFRKSITIWDVI